MLRFRSLASEKSQSQWLSPRHPKKFRSEVQGGLDCIERDLWPKMTVKVGGIDWN
jgi:hypothetical protein